MRFAYEPLVEVRISPGAILHNLKIFRELDKKLAIAPVLKSNAYGHGLVEIAKIVDGENIPFLCVDSYFEALILRNEGIRSPILVIGYTPTKNILESRLKDVAFGIVNIEGLRELSEADHPAHIHLKIDTGMHRHGISMDEIDEATRLIRANKRIVLEGVYSHLADADTPNSKHTEMQIKNWNSVVEEFKREFPNIRYFHLAATSGVSLPNIDANALRIGIGLYGFNTSTHELDLQPALEMVTRITSTRTLQKGASVGYNATFAVPNEMRVATIPVGYYEGLDRRLSNKGNVLVRNTPCLIVGRVSMNITSFDVSKVPNVKVGDLVTVISNHHEDSNSVQNIARLCETIPYDILVHIPAHLRRVVI